MDLFSKKLRFIFVVGADDDKKVWKLAQDENGVPQARLKGGNNMLVTEVYPLSNLNEWIFTFNDGNGLTMVNLKITGPSTFDWINCKLDSVYSDPVLMIMDQCAYKFSESCFKGRDCKTAVTLTAEGNL